MAKYYNRYCMPICKEIYHFTKTQVINTINIYSQPYKHIVLLLALSYYSTLLSFSSVLSSILLLQII